MTSLRLTPRSTRGATRRGEVPATTIIGRMSLLDRIAIDPGDAHAPHGARHPHARQRRLAFARLWADEAEILADYPCFGADDIGAGLQFTSAQAGSATLTAS